VIIPAVNLCEIRKNLFEIDVACFPTKYQVQGVVSFQNLRWGVDSLNDAMVIFS